MQAYIAAHWLTFTIPRELSDEELDKTCKELFGHSFKMFDKLFKPRCSYRDCYTLSELVSVYRKGWMNNEGTTCFEVSGDGLDTLALDVAVLGKYALEAGGNVCRLDIACLDTGNYLPYEQIVNSCLAANFKDRVRTKFNRGKGNAPRIEIQPVRKITFGSPKSDNYCVLYDRQKVEDLDFPCVNIEQRITNRADCAAIVRALLAGEDTGQYFAGLLRGKLEFLQHGVGNKEKRPTEIWWSDFLGDVASRKIKRVKRRSRYVSTPVQRALKQINKVANHEDIDGLRIIAKVISERQQELSLDF